MTNYRILVLGYLVRGPIGGLAWHHLQYVMGLRALGHDVCFVEDSDDYAGCYNPKDNAMGKDPSYGLEFAAQAFGRVGLADRWAYYDAHTGRWLGPCRGTVLSFARRADVLLNVSGVNPLRPWFAGIPVRVFIDTDPVFTQIRNLTSAPARALASSHNRFFSFAENIGRAVSSVPQDGFAWQPTRQPIVLDAWKVVPGPREGKFTTVMQWESYDKQEYNGQQYGMKSDSFTPYLDLPLHAGSIFELAVGSPTTPRDLLRSKGWVLVNPLEPTRDPWTYQAYIRQSKGEFAVAKQGYVVSRSGWFSERSAAYLASGRPVVVQDTAFSEWLPTGLGVLAFNTPEEAVASTTEVDRRYEMHCRTARHIAEEYFDARKVLSSLLERATATPRGVQKREGTSDPQGSE
jgi:hypothetical protein